jgi:ribosomal protein S18 acetylase RimI-like enzyme
MGIPTAEKATIREFRESDLASVKLLIQRTIDACYTGVYSPRAIQFIKECHSERKIIERHKQGRMLVAEQDGKLVATGGIFGRDIFGLFVHPEFQRRGIGKALMLELEDIAKISGSKKTTLNVSLTSIAFYAKLGYEILMKCSIDVGEGQQLDFWKARKPLT